MYAIEISNLSKSFKGKKGNRVEALQALSIAIEPGEVFGFLGPNGAGKSTTIKTLMGLIKPTSGSAKIMEIDVSSCSARTKVGYLPENPAFYDFLNAEEFLLFIGKTYGMDESAIRIQSEYVLQMMELWDARKRRIRGYSKGMVQRLGLAQVLLHDPDLYILDEPMSGLDPLGRALVKNIIRELKVRGKTVFFSTHITADVEAVCDRVGVIVGGLLRSVNTVEDVLESGIEGYHIQVKGSAGDLLSSFEICKQTSVLNEFFVPRDAFKDFIEKVTKGGLEIELIEPKRKDLEAFFLEIVAKSSV
jgi:ABC-2 type transport system ATP-binding protein